MHIRRVAGFTLERPPVGVGSEHMCNALGHSPFWLFGWVLFLGAAVAWRSIKRLALRHQRLSAGFGLPKLFLLSVHLCLGRLQRGADGFNIDRGSTGFSHCIPHV